MKANDFRLAMRRGVRQSKSDLLGFQYRSDSAEPAKIGFIVPKKSVKLATQRNLVKRRLRHAVRSHLDDFTPGSLTVFLARNHANEVAYDQLDFQVQALVRKLNSKFDG